MRLADRQSQGFPQRRQADADLEMVHGDALLLPSDMDWLPLAAVVLPAIFIPDPFAVLFVPAGEDAFDFLLVPGLVSNLVLQVHLEADVSIGFGLANPLLVIGDRLLLRGPRLLQHFPAVVR